MAMEPFVAKYKCPAGEIWFVSAVAMPTIDEMTAWFPLFESAAQAQGTAEEPYVVDVDKAGLRA